MMKLIICCHNLLFSEGLKKLLEDEPFIGKIALAESRDLKGAAHHADLVIADLDILFDHAEELFNHGHSKILVINNTSHLPVLNGHLSEFISRGVVGFLPPETDDGLLKRAIRAVSSGELWINHKSLKDLLVSGQQKSGLTKQEGQIVYYICRGYRNKEIAQRLDITEQTVKSHCNRIYKKCGVSDRLQLALLFISDRSLLKFEGRSGPGSLSKEEKRQRTPLS
jgi:DNA-binding NarL/FixJ family response regulator